jgi:hypothetical protein
MPVYNVFHVCGKDVMLLSTYLYFGQHIEIFSGKKSQIHLLGMELLPVAIWFCRIRRNDADPTDPDPVPETEISSNHFFQLVRKLEERVATKLFDILLSVILVTYFMSACL